MHIEVTKEQLSRLIRMHYIASAVYGILGDAVSDDYKEESNRVDALEAYFLKRAMDEGLHDLAEYFQGTIIPSDAFSEKMTEIIQDYDDQTFWHELEVRLGKRDFERTITETERMKLEEDGWYPERIHALYDAYAKEFESYGIDRLEIVS